MPSSRRLKFANGVFEGWRSRQIPSADFGPLVTAEALNRVKGYVALGVEEGAELVDGRPLIRP